MTKVDDTVDDTVDGEVDHDSGDAMTMRIDPELAAVVRDLPRPDFSDPAGRRAVIARLDAVEFADTMRDATDVVTVDTEIDRAGEHDAILRIRTYAPASAGEQTRPAYLHVHGGAFMTGGIDSDSLRAVALVRATGCRVFVVDYRLSPEHPFPAGLQDTVSALRWLVTNAVRLGVDPAQVGIGGISAGGNLAAATALAARDLGFAELAFMILDCAAFDEDASSARDPRYADAPVWNSTCVPTMWRNYLAGAAPDAPAWAHASPGRAEDVSGLAPTYLLVAEHDPFRDEGLAFATRLLAAGVSVELHCAMGAFHAFDKICPGTVAGRRAFDDQARFVSQAVTGRSGPTHIAEQQGAAAPRDT